MIAVRAIEIANEFVGKQESKLKPNWAPWLDNLFLRACTKNGWTPGAPYCIAAAYACYQAAAKELGSMLPFAGTASTQDFYERALEHKCASLEPHVGDIVIFRQGNTWRGHAGIVVGCSPDSVSTIEFNTSDTIAKSQRNGDGVYMKLRRFRDFPKSDTRLWIRGFVTLSKY